MGDEPDMRWYAQLAHEEPTAPDATLRTERDEAFKLLERLEATDKLEWADESGVAVDAILADFRTLIAKGK